jgi:hypothetical protein
MLNTIKKLECIPTQLKNISVFETLDKNMFPV